MAEAPRVYTVTELQRLVQAELEATFADVWVEGEISGLTRARSGHLYFTLKDEGAELSAVMWRSSAERLKFEAEAGLAVRARGYLTLYAPRGRYQMIVRSLEPVGAGPLQVRFEQLKRKLETEGLFDPARKRPLPAWPRRVALITSPTGAAVRDLIHVALRRWPPLELVVVPVAVQGETAAGEIADAIRLADGLGFDILVIGRGGGSIEDLWAFNEEVVARAVFAARTPVVSAVGHEVDFTIADFVADVRAATPSAAAETITPDGAELARRLALLRGRLARTLEGKLEALRRELEHVRQARPFRLPFEFLREAGQRLDDVAQRLGRGLTECLREGRTALEQAAARLEALSPLKVLGRGYSVTLRDGKVVRGPDEVAAGDELRTILRDGELRSRVVRGEREREGGREGE